MRYARIKPAGINTFMHVYNRTVGSAGEFVFAERETFSTRTDRRVRCWVDGLVIGSEAFVRETIATARIGFKVRKRRLVRAVNHAKAQSKDSRPALYCFKQLRLLLE